MSTASQATGAGEGGGAPKGKCGSVIEDIQQVGVKKKYKIRHEDKKM